MLEWALIGVAAGAGVARWFSRRQAQDHARTRWEAVLNAVAPRIDGRAAAGATPSLRGTLYGRTVTLTIFDIDRGPERSRAEADVALPEQPAEARLHLAWDVRRPGSKGLAHVPAVDPGAHGLYGRVVLHADRAGAAQHFVRTAALNLIDVRRDALARGLEVTIRGGYLQLMVHGFTADDAAVERTLIVAARLAQIAGLAAQKTDS